jgi:molybdate transport system ATP-binding protein
MPDGSGMLSVDMEIETGKFMALSGPSGAGKTSLLRILAGLMKPEQGFLEVDGKVWLDTGRKIDIAVQKRNIGFVFQDLALFPHLGVAENIAYGLKGKKDPSFIRRLMQMVDMEQLAARKPASLSGGQQQRVALMRALATRPHMLLLDEPFSALDTAMKQRLREYLSLVHREFRLNTILATHDLADIYRLADEVVVLEKGAVMKTGKPEEVFGGTTMAGKVRLEGEVVGVKKSGVIYIAEILTGNTVLKVAISKEESASLRPGIRVHVFTGAFNPVLKVIG